MADQASLRERIVRGDTVIGVSASVSSTRSQLEDILSKDTYDFVAADAQHSPYNEDSLVVLRDREGAGCSGTVSYQAHPLRLPGWEHPGPGTAGSGGAPGGG